MKTFTTKSTASKEAGRAGGVRGRLIRGGAVLAFAAAAAGMTGGAAQAASAQAAPAQAGVSAATICYLEVLSITSRDLQESGGDEIKVKLAEDTYGSWSFNVVNWTRNASLNSPTKAFTGTLRVDLREVDAVTYTTIDSFVVGCWRGEDVLVFENSNTMYEVTYEIR